MKTYNHIKTLKRQWRYVLLAVCVFMFTGTVYAACTSPAGEEGQVTYNTTHKVMQFCDGTNWYAMGCSGGLGSAINTAGCSDGGQLSYNASLERFECPTDSDFSNVVLLTHFDTDLSDSSPSNHTLTAAGNAAVSTAQKKFGAGSVAFDGTNDMITAPDSADWDFGSGDFTVEGWVRFGTLPGDGTYRALVNQASWNTGQRSWFMGMHGQSSGQRFTFFYTTDGSNWTYFYGDTVSYSTGVWYHFAVSRDGSNIRIFVNGEQTGSTGNISTNTIFNGTNNLEIGGRDTTETAQDHNGYIDDVRITKGVARYTADFTPPTAAFPDGDGAL